MHRKHIRFDTKSTHTTQTWLTTSFLAKMLCYHLQSERYSSIFFSMKIVIRLSHTNQADYCYALSASFRNLFLNWTKYYAKHYYLRSFGIKPDMQILVGRRRPFGTPLPTQTWMIRITFTQWCNPFTTQYLSLSADNHSIRTWKICFSAKCLFKCCLASGEKNS